MRLRYASFAALLAVARAADNDREICPTNLEGKPCHAGATGSGNEGPILTCPTQGDYIVKVGANFYMAPKISASLASAKCKTDSAGEYGNYTCGSVDNCCSNEIKAIEELCVGKEFCTIKEDIFKKALVGVEESDCGSYPSLVDIYVKCGRPPVDIGPIFAVCLLVVISISLGTTIEIDDFKEIISHKKKSCLIGFASQFGFMPLMSWLFCQIFAFDARVATGLIITGCAPGGTTSNLLTYYAKGNVALSFAMSAASTVAASFMVPLLYFLYVKQTYGGEGVSMSIGTIALFLVGTLITPCGIGILLRTKGPATPFGCGNKKRKLHKWVEKIGAVIGVIFLTLSIVVGIIENPQLITGFSLYWREWICCIAFQPLGSIFGYAMAWLGGLDGADARAVCIETGVQNFTLVIGLLSVGTVGCERAMTLRCVYLATLCYVANSCWITIFLSCTVKDKPRTITKIYPKSKMEEWSCPDVVEWVSSLEPPLQSLSKPCKTAALDGAALAQLTVEDLLRKNEFDIDEAKAKLFLAAVARQLPAADPVDLESAEATGNQVTACSPEVLP